jgi:anti-sigma factor RsiW
MNAMTHSDARNDWEHAMHLSEDQIDDQLLGELRGESASHLASCEDCAARVAAAAEPILEFREMATAWSERRSATMPLPVPLKEGLLWQRRMGWVTAAFAMALGLSIIGNGSGNRHSGGVETASVEPDQTGETPSVIRPQMAEAPRAVMVEAVQVEAVQSASPDRYSGDNRMLHAIDTELDAAVETPATLGLEPAAEPSGSQVNQTSMED